MATDRQTLERLHAIIDDQIHRPSSLVGFSFGAFSDSTLTSVDFIGPDKDPMSVPKGHFPGWVCPMPVFKGHDPICTPNGFDEDHLGQDLSMLRIGDWAGWTKKIPEVYGGRNDDKYCVPSGMIPMLAVGPGHIWFAGNAYYGWTVKIDHHAYAGFPLITYYTHMSKLFVAEWTDRAGGQPAWAGMPIGLVGAGPTRANHCHIEFWDYSPGVGSGRRNRAMDPKPFLECFGKVVFS